MELIDFVNVDLTNSDFIWSMESYDDATDLRHAKFPTLTTEVRSVGANL